MNILVTGCAGFIASHLIEELLKDVKNNIVGIDNFYSGTQNNIDFIKLQDKNNKFNFIKTDVRDFESINNIIKENNIEYIYHFAAIVSVQESIKNPKFSNEVNVQGTLNILDSSRYNNVKKVLFSSSAAVYGDEPIQPKNEKSLTKPISPYGLEKLICEQYMKLYSDIYSLETISLRYFNIYGERQNPNSEYSGVLSIFEDKIKNNEIPYIYGNGEQYRDFIYVKDVVNLSIKALNSNTLNENILCVGTSKKTSINKLLNILNKKYDKNIIAIYIEEKFGDIKESVCDNSKIKQLLKYQEFRDI